MRYAVSIQPAFSSLHSIMALLKCAEYGGFNKNTVAFTFHYGIIKIKTIDDMLYNSKTFTFHYGIIKIHMLQNL